MFPQTVQPADIYPPMPELSRRKSSATTERRFNSLIRHLRYKSRRSANYLYQTNEILDELNDMPSSIFNQSEVPERLPMIIRNLITDLLNQWSSSSSSSSETRDEELLLFRNAVVFFTRLIHQTKDVTLLISYLADSALIKATATCLSHIDRLRHRDPTKNYFKQFTRLVRLFAAVYPRLSSSSKSIDGFFPLFQGVINCLMSSSYDRVFRHLKPSAKILNREQTFFLVE